jgi:hypothetical protein
VHVQVNASPADVRLEITDDGRGVAGAVNPNLGLLGALFSAGRVLSGNGRVVSIGRLAG